MRKREIPKRVEKGVVHGTARKNHPARPRLEREAEAELVPDRFRRSRPARLACPSPLELGHYKSCERGIGHGEEATFRRRRAEAAA